jgi:hypothetical protein
VHDRKPDWDRRQSEVLGMLSRGETPLFLAAQSLNKSLIEVMLFPSQLNESERDPRRRALSFARAHARTSFAVPRASRRGNLARVQPGLVNVRSRRGSRGYWSRDHCRARTCGSQPRDRPAQATYPRVGPQRGPPQAVPPTPRALRFGIRDGEASERTTRVRPQAPTSDWKPRSSTARVPDPWAASGAVPSSVACAS